jgi:hypothetical protein
MECPAVSWVFCWSGAGPGVWEGGGEEGEEEEEDQEWSEGEGASPAGWLWAPRAKLPQGPWLFVYLFIWYWVLNPGR